jgi:hypothetical protein
MSTQTLEERRHRIQAAVESNPRKMTLNIKEPANRVRSNWLGRMWN